MGRVIGIDLGTTNSAVASMVDGKPEAADNYEGDKITPSVIHWSKDGQKTTVGQRALNMLLVAALYVLVEVKRMMGLDVIAYTHPDTGQEYSPPDGSAIIVKNLKDYAEAYYGDEVVGAVISTPAYFNDAAREATRLAAEKAGLNVLGIRNEPTMAMEAYLFQHPDLPDGKYAVMDLGGGTLDVTVVELAQGQAKVLTTDGDRRLGGTDFTMAIEQLIHTKFKEEHDIEFDPNLPEDAAYLQDIREKAERAKKELSKLEETSINVMAKGKTVSITLTRKEFEKLCQPFIDRIRETALKAIQDGADGIENLKGIILVGGTTRMRCIQDMAEELGQGKVPVLQDVQKDLCVAFACAIEAYRLSGQAEYALPAKIQDVTSFDIGVAAIRPGDRSGKMYVAGMIPKGTPLPVLKKRKFGVDSLPGQSGHQPELIVAEGKEGEEYQESMKVQAFSLVDLSASDDPTKPKVELTTSVDESGIIGTEVLDLDTGNTMRHQLKRKATH